MNLKTLMGLPLTSLIGLLATLAAIFSATTFEPNQQMNNESIKIIFELIREEETYIFHTFTDNRVWHEMDVIDIMFDAPNISEHQFSILYEFEYFLIPLHKAEFDWYVFNADMAGRTNSLNLYINCCSNHSLSFSSYDFLVVRNSLVNVVLPSVENNETPPVDEDNEEQPGTDEDKDNGDDTDENEKPDDTDEGDTDIQYEERITLDFNLRFNFINTENEIYRFENISAEETITMIVNDQEHVFLLEMIVNRDSLLHSLRDYLTTGDEVVFKIADKIIYGTVTIGSMAQLYFTDIETHIELIEPDDEDGEEQPGTDEDKDNGDDTDENEVPGTDESNEYRSWLVQFIDFLIELFFVPNAKKE